MKKSFRKVLGLLLSIAMVASLLPSMALAAETDGYYIKLEETDAKARNSFGDVRTNEFFSGGQARSFGSNNAPGEDGYYIEFEVDIKKAGDYKIWVHGGRSGPDWSSPTKIVIDGTTTLSCTNGDVTSWSAKDYGINHALAFQYVDAKLTKGKHIIRYMINEVAPSNTSWYLGAFDFMLVMPANYSWTQSKTALPTAPEYKEFDVDGYAWIQENEYSAKEGNFTNRTADVFSDGAAYTLDTSSGTRYSLDYYLEVPESGSYDLWIYGTVPHKYASPAKVQLNGETIEMTKVGGDVWYNSKWVYGWNKATVNLDAGNLDLRYLIDEKRPNGNDYFFAVLDMICIVPTSYEWTQSLTDKPVKPAPIEPEEPEKNYIPFNEEGYLCLEAETDYSFKHSAWCNTLTDGNHTNLISGSGWGTSQGSAPGANGYNIDFDIDVAETGSYDIWVYGGRIASSWVSPSKIRIDGEEINPQLAHYSNDNWGKQSGSNVNLGWAKTTVTLAEGEQTLSYYIDTVITGNNTSYVGAIDLIYIVPASYYYVPSGTGKTAAKPEKPAELEAVSKAWIEGEDYFTTNREASHGLDFYSNGKAWAFAEATAPEGGYYADFNVRMVEGNYDIYFRGSDDTYNEWMSDIAFSVDGVAKEYASVVSEGWSHSGGYAMGWMKISDVAMNDIHTLRYAIVASRTAGAETYIGSLDAIVIVPAGAPFTPVAANIPATQADFELCTILKDIDLSNVKEDIELPEALEDGTEIVWTSSNTRVITDDGVVTRPVEEDVVVVLTATVGDATKDFAVTVKYVERFEVSDFVINGTAAAGETMTASATVKRNDGEDGMINLILAVYNQDDQMVAVDICELAGTAEGTDYDCEVTIDSDEEGTLYAKAFLWTEFSKLEPIMSGISTLD